MTKTYSPFDKRFFRQSSGSQLCTTLVPAQQIWQKDEKHFLSWLLWRHKSPHELKQDTESFHSRRHVDSLARHLRGASVLRHAAHVSITLLVYLVFIATYPATSNGTKFIKSCSHPWAQLGCSLQKARAWRTGSPTWAMVDRQPDWFPAAFLERKEADLDAALRAWQIPKLKTTNTAKKSLTYWGKHNSAICTLTSLPRIRFAS